MSNTLTFRQALEQANAKVDHTRLALKAAEAERDALVVRLLDAGASFRDVGRELHVSATTVLRRYGTKGRLDDHVSALDLPVRNAPSRPRETAPGTQQGPEEVS